MKVKKHNLLIALIGISCIFLLYGCQKEEVPVSLSKIGVAPYMLSEEDRYILDSFGMSDTSQIILFNAPEEAITLEVNLYQLGSDGAWEVISNGCISIGEEREPVNQLTGNVAIQLRDDYSIDFQINAAGSVSFQSEPVQLDQEMKASVKGFLTDFQNMELNEEIPVAIMVYDDGNHMQSYTTEDYFQPSKFEGMGLVQAVTLRCR